MNNSNGFRDEGLETCLCRADGFVGWLSDSSFNGVFVEFANATKTFFETFLFSSACVEGHCGQRPRPDISTGFFRLATHAALKKANGKPNQDQRKFQPLNIFLDGPLALAGPLSLPIPRQNKFFTTAK